MFFGQQQLPEAVLQTTSKQPWSSFWLYKNCSQKVKHTGPLITIDCFQLVRYVMRKMASSDPWIDFCGLFWTGGRNKLPTVEKWTTILLYISLCLFKISSYWHELADCLIWWIWPTLLRIWSIFSVIIVVLAFLVNILALLPKRATSARKLLHVRHCPVFACDLRPSFSGYSMGWSPGYLFEASLKVFKFDFWTQFHAIMMNHGHSWCDFKVKVFADFDWGRNPSNFPNQRQKSVMFPDDFSTLRLEANSRILRRCES